MQHYPSPHFPDQWKFHFPIIPNVETKFGENKVWENPKYNGYHEDTEPEI
jgi:hypothetical protein